MNGNDKNTKVKSIIHEAQLFSSDYLPYLVSVSVSVSGPSIYFNTGLKKNEKRKITDTLEGK